MEFAQACRKLTINAMLGAETMTGYQQHKVIALPHDRLRQMLKRYGR